MSYFQDEATKLGLKVNWAKTKLMYVGDGPTPQALHLGRDEVEFVPTFIYFGSLISEKGDLKAEIARRRGLAAGVMQSLWRPMETSLHLKTNKATHL